ncbi:hypothetical protein Tco_1084864 [Tanacetum coccineum]
MAEGGFKYKSLCALSGLWSGLTCRVSGSFGSFFLDVLKSLSLEYEHVAMNLTMLERVCEEQVHLNSVLMRLIDDLLALDSIVRFDLSERRLEQTATFSIPTISECDSQ